MNTETITHVMPRRRRASGSGSTFPQTGRRNRKQVDRNTDSLQSAPVAVARRTLQISCTICGSRAHAKQRCSLRIDDEKTGEAR